MNKTTSFSKIKNNIIKNDLIAFNNTISSSSSTSSSQAVATNKEKQQQADKGSFFIDSINEHNLNGNNFDRNNLLFEPAPIELFADSIITSIKEQQQISTVDSIILNDNDKQQAKLKNWSSESNLTKSKKKLNKLNKSCINNDSNNQETGESYDDYDYDLENDDDPLQFSDHAGLFDNYENEEEENVNLNEHDQSHSNLLLNNYDVYKATKTNYKLTYNNDNNELFTLEKPNSKSKSSKNNYSIRNYQINTQNDSLITSNLVMQQSNNLDESNYVDYEEDEDDENEYNYNNRLNDDSNQEPLSYNNANNNDYYYYLNKLTNSQQAKQQNPDLFASSIASNSNLNDSIMNWSMKISNYNYNNHYQQQKQQLQYQLNSKRSQSRSPLSAVVNDKQFIDQQSPAIPRSNSSFSKLYFNNHYNNSNNYIMENSSNLESQSKAFLNNNKQQINKQPLSNKSTTSWGKLKHSKSSSSNIGVTHSYSASQNVNNETSSSINNQDDEEQCSLLQSVHVNDNNVLKSKLINEQNQQTLPSLSSPSLFRLFQYSKAANRTFEELNTSSETNSYSNNNNNKSTGTDLYLTNNATNRTNRRGDHLKEIENDENNIANKSKTTFSQLRQRSLSSCAIGQTETNKPQLNETVIPKLNNISNNKSNLVVVVDTNSNLNSNKKSVGIQHPSQNHVDQSIQTSTIVCMLVDRNNSKTSKELMEVAARAARAAVAARRSVNLFNTKSSLPDLTFLKDYSDDVTTRCNTVSNEKNNEQITEMGLNNNVQLKTSLSSANLIKPISDLIKLDELAIKKTIMNGQQQQQQQQQQTITGSELLKRKTLKSIKRYRQTKQNTEPCNAITDEMFNNRNNYSEYDSKLAYYNQQQNVIPALNKTKSNTSNTNNSSSSSTSSSSGTTNTSGYASNLNPQSQLTNQQNQSDKQKQPLKSCLKRKDSSSSNQQNHFGQPSNVINTNNNQKQSKMNPTSSLIVAKNNNKQNANAAFEQLTKQINLQTSTQMYLPYVGYLYTWDKESSTRYVYYNNLERTRRIKSYRQLIKCKKSKTNDENDYEDEEEDDEEEEEEEKSDQLKQNKTEQQKVTSSRSYNDLRVKKSVTFLSHVIEHKQAIKKSKSNSVSPSSTNTTIETTGTLSTSSSSSSTATTQLTSKQPSPFNPNKNKLITKSNAPLLQYDALIAMLKSNSVQKNSEQKTFRQSPQLISKNRNIQDRNINRKNSNIKLERHNSNENYFKKSQIIDADSISLASLSESPPSEFKFSDDDEYDMKTEEALNQAIKLNNSTKSFTNTMTTNSSSSSTSSSAASSSTSSNNIINYQNNHTSDNSNLNKQQQLKFNQMELIRNKKKNFHSILLKDNKLNNLKEILLEIKEQQQKLIYLANESKSQLKKNALLENNPSGLDSLTPSSSSSTINQTSIIATTTSDTTVSIELKDTIERLSQYLFEFLKQGLKPISFETLSQHSSNLSTSGFKTPALSPSLVERALPDSSSLTLTYSQYTQLWNLIEHTINVNLVVSNEEHQSENDLSFQMFKLPKEAYVNMFQDINSYSNNTNQTYLIDSGINTSQLRRKHHFMVNLMSLKFKFQLFIINLLNYKQLGNWFEYLNKDKNILKKFYDLKLISSNSNNSGDSGVGDFICMSASSSSNSSLSVSTNNANNSNGYNLIASLSLTSLANVSIFENEEYFSYFHKLIQQFNFIEFNLKISKDKAFEKQKPNNNDNIIKQVSAPRKSSSSLSRRNSNTQTNQKITPSPSTPNANTAFNNNQANHSVFNLKNISKRLNIKSWFTSSSQQTPVNNSTLPSMSSNNIKHHISSENQYSPHSQTLKQKPSAPTTSPHVSTQQVYKKLSNAPNKVVGTKSRGPINKILNSSSLMKHSLSEPSLNEIIE